MRCDAMRVRGPVGNIVVVADSCRSQSGRACLRFWPRVMAMAMAQLMV